MGIEDKPEGDQNMLYDEFKEQLQQGEDGRYQTGLMWKPNHPKLYDNKSGSIGRLKNLVTKLRKDPKLLEQYDQQIHKCLEEGIIEKAPDDIKGKEFYLPHKAVVKENAETTKVRIVYDASAKPEGSPSLNECLETGPPLQKPSMENSGKNKNATSCYNRRYEASFPSDQYKRRRDALRFHWLKNPDEFQLQVYRFTRLIFGLGQASFILGGTIEEHLKKYLLRFQEIVEEIMRAIYVDDIIGGADTVEHARKFKETCISIFEEAKFKLHKWHSNVPELESDHVEHQAGETYAKEQLQPKESITSILGVPWNKTKDSISVIMPTKDTPITKRGILQYLASIYDPLGLSSPVLLVGKMIYRDVFEMKVAWDKPLEGQNLQRWDKWRSNLQNFTKIPRSIPCYEEPIQRIDLHGFGDASKDGSSAAVYAVVYQRKAVQQGLLVAKSRLSKKNLSIPRLELAASHMTSNLLKNTMDALVGFPIGKVTAWSDSTTVPHWLKGNGKYKQFVKNRVDKIKEKKFHGDT